MSPGAMAIEGSDLKVNGNVSGGLVSDGSTVTVNGNVTGNGIDTVIAKKGTVTVNGTVTATDLSEKTGVLASNGSNLTVGDTEVGGKESTGVIAESGSKATAGNVKVSGGYMSSGWLCGADAAESGRIHWIFIPELSFRCGAGRSIMDGKSRPGRKLPPSCGGLWRSSSIRRPQRDGTEEQRKIEISKKELLLEPCQESKCGFQQELFYS